MGTANLGIFFKTPERPEHPVPKLYSGTNDWTFVSLEGDAPKDTYEAWAWFQYECPARGRVYWDDCSVEVLGNSPKPPPPPKPPKPPKTSTASSSKKH